MLDAQDCCAICGNLIDSTRQIEVLDCALCRDCAELWTSKDDPEIIVDNDPAAW